MQRRLEQKGGVGQAVAPVARRKDETNVCRPVLHRAQRPLLQRLEKGAVTSTLPTMHLRFHASRIAVLALLAAPASALPPPQPVSPFDMIGVLQSATLGGSDSLAGGTVTVHGQVVTIPRNTVVLLPATALTWQELFRLAPAPYGPNQTGMAQADLPAPTTTWQVHVTGNRVGDQYIAGLVSVTQDELNAGQGWVNFIDYSTGEFRVGGVIGDPSTGQRVRLNDPIGRFGRVTSPDVRFTIDEDNPTVRATTGYPMCIPRTDPAALDDWLCPQGNRPRDPTTGGFLSIFHTPDPALGVMPDANRAAPFEVGDYVTYSGILVKDGTSPTAGAFAGVASSYVAAYSVVANVGIFTAYGIDPAYVAIDVTILGVGRRAHRRGPAGGDGPDPVRGLHDRPEPHHLPLRDRRRPVHRRPDRPGLGIGGRGSRTSGGRGVRALALPAADEGPLHAAHRRLPAGDARGPGPADAFPALRHGERPLRRAVPRTHHRVPLPREPRRRWAGGAAQLPGVPVPRERLRPVARRRPERRTGRHRRAAQPVAREPGADGAQLRRYDARPADRQRRRRPDRRLRERWSRSTAASPPIRTASRSPTPGSRPAGRP